MNHKKIRIIRRCVLLALLILVWLVQYIPSWGEAYARSVYPFISGSLPVISSFFPFSIGDLFIFTSVFYILFSPLQKLLHKIKWKRLLMNDVEYLAWVYVWFYLAWGLNYSQQNFYQRTHVPYSAYSEENFRGFLNEYIDSLNAAYVPVKSYDRQPVEQNIMVGYRTLDSNLGIHRLKGSPRVKTMMFSSLFTSMGISGYMGPFFCEFNLNGELLPAQYPSTYAHEMAHLLGITSEAEANFYAYQVCTRSDVPVVRFCGYFSVMNYILNNARGFLPEEDYKEVISRIRPEIIETSREISRFWTENYSEFLSNLQGRMYDVYLKGNKISSGRKNYSEVVGLLISWREYEKGKSLD